jgi:hypothetical protein
MRRIGLGAAAKCNFAFPVLQLFLQFLNLKTAIAVIQMALCFDFQALTARSGAIE